MEKLMRMFKVRQKFIDDITSKYKNQYSINLKSWLPNPYYTLKYKFICEMASFLSYFFLKSGITANFVTFLNLFLGIVALVIFALNINELKFLAIIIFFSKQILDNVDGFIARKNRSSSKFGAKLDSICGHVYYHSVLISLVFHNYYIFNEVIFLYLGLISLLLDILIIKNKKKKYNFNIRSLPINNFYIFLKIINYDGRTIKTDFILFIILIESFFYPLNISFLLIFVFLTPKLLRNFFILYKLLI